jgi:hypothetical protein
VNSISALLLKAYANGSQNTVLKWTTSTSQPLGSTDEYFQHSVYRGLKMTGTESPKRESKWTDIIALAGKR